MLPTAIRGVELPVFVNKFIEDLVIQPRQCHDGKLPQYRGEAASLEVAAAAGESVNQNAFGL